MGYPGWPKGGRISSAFHDDGSPPKEWTFATGIEFRDWLGAGAMGEVWRVYDPGLDRTLALKVLREELASNAGHVARFLREAQLTAGLEHKGIAPVHFVGRLPDGRPYYTMKELAGRTLAEEIASPTADTLEMLGWLVEVADALAYAHQTGIVHRDVKPANILIGAFGEVTLLDWGIARRADAVAADPGPEGAPTIDVYGTRLGVVVGTPGFMSPEQGRGGVVGPTTDVFALGLTLRAIVRRLEQPDLPADPGAGLPGTLQDLARSALAAEPAARMSDAAGFRDALQEWLDNARARERGRVRAQRSEAALLDLDEISARVALEVLIRLADPRGRSRSLDMSLLATLHPRVGAVVEVLVSAGTLRIDDGAVSWADAALVADWDRLSACIAAEGPALGLRDRVAAAAAAWIEAGSGPDALWRGELLTQALAWRSSSRPILAARERAFLDAAAADEHARHRRRQAALWMAATGLAASALFLTGLWLEARRAWSQERMAHEMAEARALLARGLDAEQVHHSHEALAFYLAAQALGAEGAQEATEQIAAEGIASKVIPVAPGGAWRAAMSQDERSVFVSGADGWVRRFDVATGEISAAYGPQELDALDIVVVSGSLLVWGWFQDVRQWDVRTQRLISRWDTSVRAGRGMRLVGQDLLVTTGRDRRVQTWNVPSGTLLAETYLGARGFRYTSVRDLLGVQDAEGRGYVFSLPALKQIWFQSDAGRSGVISDGDDLVFLSADGTWVRVDALGPPGIQATTGRLSAITSVHDAWSLQDILVVAESGGDLALLAPGSLSPTRLEGHTGDVADVAIDDTRRLMISLADEESIVWDLADGVQRAVLHGHLGPVKTGVWSGPRRLTTVSLDGTARIWDLGWLEDGKRWLEDGEVVEDVQIAPDGTGWAWCTASGRCAATDGQVRWPLGDGVTLLAMADGCALSATAVGTLRVDGPGGRLLEVPEPPGVKKVALSCHPVRLAVVSQSGELHTWAASDPPAIRTTSVGADPIAEYLDLVADRLVVVHGDQSIELWEVSTGRMISQLPMDVSVIHADAVQGTARGGAFFVPSNHGGAWHFSLDDGALRPPIAPGTSRVLTLLTTPDGRTLVTTGFDRRIYAYSLLDGSELFSAGPFEGLPNHAAMSPDSRWYAVYDDQGDVRVWDIDARRLVRRVYAGVGLKRRVAFLPDGRLVAGYRQHWRVWSLTEPPPLPSSLTNLRVCRETARVVPVIPFPLDTSPWAPPEACASQGGKAGAPAP